MSWAVVAKKDFQDAIRSRALWGLSALFLVLVGLFAVVYATVDEVSGGDPSALGLIFFVAGAIGTFVSVAAIVTCYKSLAGERESGSMKLMLSLPHTRRDVVLGKLVGRTTVLAVPIVIALVVGIVLGMGLLGDIAPVATVLLGIVGIFFALTYAGIMVGLSATTGSTSRAAALAIGFLLVFEFLWDVVVLGLVFVTNGFALPTGGFPEWVFPVSQVAPSNAFVTTLSAVIPDSPAAAAGQGPSATQIDAFFGTPWVGVVMLALWTVVPIVLGYWQFQSADL
ncbi:ABC transporter permease [Salinibaculum salinum]|uniref:ABC transporter permease n=1 Tax=Salinibaculum salinum TaxID=3131996 RepID=UPI0030EC5794